MRKKKNRNLHKSVWENDWWLLKKIWQYTPGFVIWMFAEGIIWGINHAVSIIYVKRLFDALEQAKEFETIAKVILSYAVFMLCFFAFHYWFADTYNPKMREKLHIAMHSDLFHQAVRIDLEKYDSPEFYNDFIWSMDQSCKLAIEFLEDTGKLVNRVVASFTLIGVLLSVDKAMAALIFLLVIIRIFLIYFVNKTSLGCKKEQNPLERKDEYIKRVFKLPDYAKELRITRVVHPLFKEHTNNVEQMKAVNRNYGKKLAVLMALIYGISLTGESLLIILILYKVLVLHTLGLSGFVVAVNASWKMSWLLGDMAERLMKYHEHGIFVEKIITFLECEPQIMDGTLEAVPFESLVIKNLKFGYDIKEEKKYVVNDISMQIRKGEKIAIVGYNGAGKTTLTKLLMRLYDPDAEYALNQAISEYAEQKTVIFISHRLSTTRNADRIYMFDGGKIIESGTHEELIAANGKYAYMFQLQAERYQN